MGDPEKDVDVEEGEHEVAEDSHHAEDEGEEVTDHEGEHDAGDEGETDGEGDGTQKKGKSWKLGKKPASWSGSLKKSGDKKWGSMNSIDSLAAQGNEPTPEEAAAVAAAGGDANAPPGSLSKRFGRQLMANFNRLRTSSKSDSHDGEKPEGHEDGEQTDEEKAMVRAASLPQLTAGASKSAEEVVPPGEEQKILQSILKVKTDEEALRQKKHSKHKSSSNKEKVVLVKFNEIVTVRRTWARKDYDRKGEVTWKLTADRAVDIRNELNEFKKEMTIHQDSRINTHFY